MQLKLTDLETRISDLERFKQEFQGKSTARCLPVDTVNTKAKQYQECETLITRIEVRIMRLKGEG